MTASENESEAVTTERDGREKNRLTTQEMGRNSIKLFSLVSFCCLNTKK